MLAGCQCRKPVENRCLSKLVRNVPFLTSIEMSPFFVLYLFLLLSAVALEKFLASKPQERRSSSRSTYGIPVFRPVGLARSVALRSPQGEALRAKCRARPTIEVVPLLALHGMQGLPAFSPDGNQVAFGEYEGEDGAIYTRSHRRWQTVAADGEIRCLLPDMVPG